MKLWTLSLTALLVTAIAAPVTAHTCRSCDDPCDPPEPHDHQNCSSGCGYTDQVEQLKCVIVTVVSRLICTSCEPLP